MFPDKIIKEDIVMDNVYKVEATPERLEIKVSREFDAPRELVFKTFTNPDLYVKWFLPKKIQHTAGNF